MKSVLLDYINLLPLLTHQFIKKSTQVKLKKKSQQNFVALTVTVKGMKRTSQWSRKQKGPIRCHRAWHSKSRAHQKLEKQSKSQPLIDPRWESTSPQLASRRPWLEAHHRWDPYYTSWSDPLKPIRWRKSPRSLLLPCTMQYATQ